MIKYYVREYERQRHYIYPICCAQMGKKVETGFTIIDLKDGSTSLLSPSVQGFVKIASGICQDYYPETLGCMFIVNTSWIIRAGWTIVKAFLDSKTVSKIHICGSSFEKELLEYVNAENLPEFLGGKCKCLPGGCLEYSDGPWRSLYDKFPKEDDPNDTKYPPLPAKWRPAPVIPTTAFKL